MNTRRRFLAAAGAIAVARSARAGDPDPALVKAMDAVRAAIPVAAEDPERPRYHFGPPANWNNDPNGTLFFKGWHHLFYLSSKKHPGNPVLTQAALLHGPINQWRDPFLFREGGRVYAVLGGSANGGRGGTGQVQLYRADNAELSKWKHLGVVFQADERETYNIECPNLFKIENKWVLITSPQRPCQYFVGDLDLNRVKFTPELRGVVDAGDAYASNISKDDQGRTILWLWGRTNTPPGRGWNSTMAMPRILSLGSGGFLRQRVPKEFEQLRGAMVTAPSAQLGDTPLVLTGIPGDAVEIEVQFSGDGFGLEVRRSAAAKPALTLAMRRGTLVAGDVRTFTGPYKLRVSLDGRCLEVYVNDGTAALYRAVDARQEGRGIAVFARSNRPNANVQMESLTAWPMRAASFSLEHFHI